MYKIMNNEVDILDIAMYLDAKINFYNAFYISHPSAVDSASAHSIVFIEQCSIELLMSLPENCLLLTRAFDVGGVDKGGVKASVLFSSTPEQDFYRVVGEFFVQEPMFTVHPSVIIEDSVTLGVNVHIGKGSYLASDVMVGSNTYIGRNVIIHEGSQIGANCHIKDGAIIGSESFKFVEDGHHLTMAPFFGHIVIEDEVWIGANAIIERPAFDSKVIGRGVKIDDLVQVGADVAIASKTQIAAGTIIGRNVCIGKQCLLGINTVIKPNVTLADQVSTGVGCVVISDLAASKVYVGNPAKLINAN